MGYAFKKYFLSIFIILSPILSEQIVYEYTIHEGANLVSFPLLTDNYDIDYFFSDSNTNLITGTSLESHIISLITEGEMTFINNEQWLGSLDEIDNKKGYWLISNQELKTCAPVLHFNLLICVLWLRWRSSCHRTLFF